MKVSWEEDDDKPIYRLFIYLFVLFGAYLYSYVMCGGIVYLNVYQRRRRHYQQHLCHTHKMSYLQRLEKENKEGYNKKKGQKLCQRVGHTIFPFF